MAALSALTPPPRRGAGRGRWPPSRRSRRRRGEPRSCRFASRSLGRRGCTWRPRARPTVVLVKAREEGVTALRNLSSTRPWDGLAPTLQVEEAHHRARALRLGEEREA